MSDNKFVKAYDELMENLYEIMDDSLHSVADAMEIAKEKTIEGLSKEDIDRVANFLMRDIEHIASANTPIINNESLSECFKFDVELLENFALDAFTSIADKTRIELAKIENQAKKYHSYKSGDIAGPGTFICDQCGKQIAFKSTSEIPECPECKGKTFVRS
ncbi:MAG: zinc ribbon-containing protein [Methylococcaceae bacterium]|nr:zinc ribbon-containing protein [Methylococcaceae bacterium]